MDIKDLMLSLKNQSHKVNTVWFQLYNLPEKTNIYMENRLVIARVQGQEWDVDVIINE